MCLVEEYLYCGMLFDGDEYVFEMIEYVWMDCVVFECVCVCGYLFFVD